MISAEEIETKPAQQPAAPTLEQQWSLLLPPRRQPIQQHFVEYCYCRLIPVTLLSSTTSAEIIAVVAAREKNSVTDYRFLNMSSGV